VLVHLAGLINRFGRRALRSRSPARRAIWRRRTLATAARSADRRSGPSLARCHGYAHFTCCPTSRGQISRMRWVALCCKRPVLQDDAGMSRRIERCGDCSPQRQCTNHVACATHRDASIAAEIGVGWAEFVRGQVSIRRAVAGFFRTLRRHRAPPRRVVGRWRRTPSRACENLLVAGRDTLGISQQRRSRSSLRGAKRCRHRVPAAGRQRALRPLPHETEDRRSLYNRGRPVAGRRRQKTQRCASTVTKAWVTKYAIGRSATG
jgi:hypothetical protein